MNAHPSNQIILHVESAQGDYRNRHLWFVCWPSHIIHALSHPWVPYLPLWRGDGFHILITRRHSLNLMGQPLDIR